MRGLYKAIICAATVILLNFNNLTVRAQSNNNIIINQGGGEYPHQIVPSGEIFINGVSSKEDVGGVEIGLGKYRGWGNNDLYFKNYNNFAVNVLYIVHVPEGDKYVPKTGSIVLKALETKFSRDSYYRPQDFRLIARRMKEESRNIDQTNSSTKQEDLPDGDLQKYGGYFYVYPDLVKCRIRDIDAFISNLNSKGVYGKRNWRRATPTEARIVFDDFDKVIVTQYGDSKTKGEIYYGTSETYEKYDNKNSIYQFILVCE